MAKPNEAMTPTGRTLTDTMAAIVGADHVLTDSADTTLYAQDIYSRGLPLDMVVRPDSTEALAAVVAAAVSADRAVIPRGGGMSYTGGYLATESGSVLVDTSRMNRVLDVNREDMTVTVECGCTWKALHEALHGTGLRTPFWGTLSGIHATVGGGLSQNGIFWGSGRYGTAAESVLSLTVVLADGAVVPTGSAARESADAFFRHYGPDLTGLFCADTGALGFKATATLRLIDELPAHRFASFDFADRDAMLRAMSELARRALPMECFAFDPFLSGQRMQRESVLKDVKALGNMLKAAGSVGSAIKQGAKVAMAGRRFMNDAQYSLHLVFEERDDGAADETLRLARSVCTSHEGRELDDSIPRLLRANPFTPLNNVVGPRGERWAPVHTVVPHSRAVAMTQAIEGTFEAHGKLIEQHDIGIGYLFATVGTTGFVVEPVFFYPDAMGELHRATVEPGILSKLPGFEENTPAREAVATIRAALAQTFADGGGVHMQIGKSYRFAETHDAAAYAVLEKIKRALDPTGRVNPGSLGLAADGTPND